MQPLPMLPLKIFFISGLVCTLIAGIYLLKNYEKWFGLDPDKASETSGERTYSKAQMVICWVIAMKLFLMLSLMV